LLDLVYSHVCGPFNIESLSSNRYFVSSIDDASRKMWTYMLRSKDQVFRNFHAMVERETWKFLKYLRFG